MEGCRGSIYDEMRRMGEGCFCVYVSEYIPLYERILGRMMVDHGTKYSKPSSWYL